MDINMNYQTETPRSFLPRDPQYGVGDKPLVGVVGHGFVGKAVERSFIADVDRFLVDPNYGTTIDQLIERQPALVFVCTPTPVGANGEIDAAITCDAILKILNTTQAGVVLKSTVTPDVITNICNTVCDAQQAHRFIYSPEFLTEKNAAYEFANPEYVIMGGSQDSIAELADFFEFSTVVRMPTEVDRTFCVHPVEASYIKYAINSYLALKVTFFNQLNDALEEDINCLPNRVLKIISAEPRVGRTHWQAPGPDGKKGFGGACFPKDVSAFIKFSDKFSLLESVMDINNEYRAEYDLDDREKEQNITFLTEGDNE
jgi:UDPglucose 6-dehydrogenase